MSSVIHLVSYFSEDSCMFEKPDNLTETITDDFEATALIARLLYTGIVR